MDDQSGFVRQPGPDRNSRRGRILVQTLLAVALIVPLGVYETIPVKQHKATAPPPIDTQYASRPEGRPDYDALVRLIRGYRARGRSLAPLFSCCSYAHPIHSALETDQDRIVNLRLIRAA
jgi:hypothetical protein